MTVMHARMKYGMTMLVIVGMAALIFVWPIHRRIAAQNNQLQTLHMQLNKTDELLKRITLADQDVHAAIERKETELKEIPKQPDLPGLIHAITSSIADLPLQGSNVNRAHSGSLDRDRAFGLVIETGGQFSGVFDLIRSIEQLPRLIRINELTVRTDENSEDPSLVTASIDISAFYEPASNKN